MLATCCLLFASCDDVFDIHPYDVNVKEKDVNAQEIAKIETKLKDKQTYKFAFISDSHQWLSDLSDEVKSINNHEDVDFVIHGGDATDFGATQEFEWTRGKLKKLNVPCVLLLGNHDCLGTGNQTYEAMFGKPDFAFIAGRVKFVCLNTNAIEYDYSQAVPNFDFMEAQETDRAEEFDRTVVCMHAAPYSEQFNNNVAKPFRYYLSKFPNLMFCLYGHGHHTEQSDIYGDGLMFYEVGNAPKRQYYIFTVTPTEYKYEIIDF